jgi:hypothetical protein
VWVTLDSALTENAPEPISNASFLENLWLSAGVVVQNPEGTTYVIEYASSHDLVEPDVWFSDYASVEERRYIHVRVTLEADSTLRLSPMLPTGYPFLEYATYLGGHVHLPKLLRSDGTEFPGGAYIMGIGFPMPAKEYDVRAPAGRTIAHLRTGPIEKLGPFGVRVLSEAAMREIVDTSLDEEFMVEAHERRMRVRLAIVEQLNFKFSEDPPNILHPTEGDMANKFYAIMDAEVEGADVYEIAPMTERVL